MHWQYLKAVIRHKRFVYEEGRKLGVGRWQLLIHDWSKFLPSEWVPYAEQFYGHPGRKPEEAPAFRVAWLKHQKRNPHHWQFWVIMEDSGKVGPLEMPIKYLLEMVADWRGANRAYGDQSMLAWYSKSKPARQLAPRTLARVEHLLFGRPIVINPINGLPYSEEERLDIKRFYTKELLRTDADLYRRVQALEDDALLQKPIGGQRVLDAVRDAELRERMALMDRRFLDSLQTDRPLLKERITGLDKQ